MKTAAALALSLFLSPALADTVSASISNLTLTGATWGDLSGTVGATSSVPGQDTVSDIAFLSGLTGAHTVSAGGVTASKNADGTLFTVTADERTPGTGYWGGITLRSDFLGQLAAIAPGATANFFADFTASAVNSGHCETNDCGASAYAGLSLYVGLTRDPYPGQEIRYIDDAEGIFTLTSDSFAGRLQASYTNTTGFWQYAAVTLQFGLDGIVAPPIPEPSTYALLALGLGAVAVRSSRRST